MESPKIPGLVLVGGRVVTLESDLPAAEAVAVEAGKVSSVGSSEEVLRKAPPGARVIDLHGRTVVPGLIDSHLHIAAIGRSLADVDLYDVSSIEEIVERLAERARSEPGDGLVAGRGDCFHASSLAEGRLPDSDDLDRVSRERPVAITDVNKTIVNSFILKGVDTSQVPAGGVVGTRSPGGQPNGVFLYAAKALTPLGGQSAATAAHMTTFEAIRRAQDALLASGLTGVLDGSLGTEEMEALHALRSRNLLRIRVRGLARASRFNSVEAISKGIESFGPGDDWLRLVGVKLFYDPFLMHRTAAMHEPYLGEGVGRGRSTMEPAELRRWLCDCAKAGYPTGTHTTGDRGLDEVLGAHEGAAEEVGLRAPSHLIHVYFPSGEALSRIRALGFAVALQPSFIRPWAESAIEFLGISRASRFTPVRSLLDANIPVGGGTDAPITRVCPFASMASAVTRRSAAGRVLGPEECVSQAEALRLYTLGSAEVSGEERTRGSIRAGKLADLVVCSEDPTTCPAEALRRLRAVATIVGGVLAYSDGSLSEVARA